MKKEYMIAIGAAAVIGILATRRSGSILPQGDPEIDIDKTGIAVYDAVTGQRIYANSPVELTGGRVYIIAFRIVNNTTQYGEFIPITVDYDLTYGLSGNLQKTGIILPPNSTTIVETITWNTSKVTVVKPTDIDLNITSPVNEYIKQDVNINPEEIIYVVDPAFDAPPPDSTTPGIDIYNISVVPAGAVGWVGDEGYGLGPYTVYNLTPVAFDFLYWIF